MANEEHLSILRQGVEAWNKWREANPELQPDLTKGILEGADLKQANLQEADLEAIDLVGCNLTRANLSGANLTRALFEGANLFRASLAAANSIGADFTKAYLVDANLEWTQLIETEFEGADLSGASLKGAELIRANLSNCTLERADLRLANLFAANLTGSKLVRSSLHRTNFTEANLQGVSLEGAHLLATNFHRANLSKANLHNAQTFETIFSDVDLSDALGLDSISHVGPSTLGSSTLFRYGHQMPQTFLRGCGVPDAVIEYLPAIVAAMEPIQFYSCFISYSTKDQDFAQRLYEQMQSRHLRVWFAPKDLRGGRKIHEEIDQAIRVYDKLIVVLSEDSIKSEWVKTEIYNARRIEIKQGQRKLFPIRLVDMSAIKEWKFFDADTGKDLGREVREYYIPDFTNWKDHDEFEAAFSKLLRDLKAAETTVLFR